MRPMRSMFVLIASVVLLFALACGGDDDSSSSNDSPVASGSNGPSPAGLAEQSGSPGDSTSDTTEASVDTVGTITVGDDTWALVASVQCDFVSIPDPPVTVVTIAGHAEGDESIEIGVDFDPRDTGLRLTVQGPGGEPSWAAISETFTTRVGATTIGGEGAFSSSGGGAETEGSFDIRC